MEVVGKEQDGQLRINEENRVPAIPEYQEAIRQLMSQIGQLREVNKQLEDRSIIERISLMVQIIEHSELYDESFIRMLKDQLVTIFTIKQPEGVE